MKLYLVLWDMGWSGAMIKISSNPSEVIEQWRVREEIMALKGIANHDPTKNKFNPWERDLARCKDTVTFIMNHNIQTFEVEDGLELVTEGDS